MTPAAQTNRNQTQIKMKDTKKYRAIYCMNCRTGCKRRTGSVVPRAEHFGDLITADCKVLSEESESRNSRQYAVVVRDSATLWIQSYPCKTNFPGDPEEPNEVPEADEETKSHLHRQFLRIWQSL